MAKKRLSDMVILLPGITGSVLQKDGEDRWAISGQAAWHALTNLGSVMDDLVLKNDDPEADELGDGICATRIMPDFHIVPGLNLIDGYSKTSLLITNNFNVEIGHIDSRAPANFYEFPYDWRRDNRVSARKLKQLIDRQLPVWRESSGAKDAKVILLAHSMGGLVSRYYLEVLNGWRDCKAFISFGTPYRGSVKALDYLSRGYKKLFIDLTEAMRSFTALYQLLPIYPVLDVNGKFKRVSEVESVPGVCRKKAEQALAFHREIEKAVDAKKNNAEYKENGYKTLPIVGTRQPTLQSAVLCEGRVTTSRQVPAGIDKILEDGDGTVPRLSAIPIELSDDYRDTYVAERHGSLQTNDAVLKDLLGRIAQMQVKGLGAIRGPKISPEYGERAAISLDVDDIYLAGEPLTLRVQLVNVEKQHGFGSVLAQLERVGEAVQPIRREFLEAEEGWSLALKGMTAGVYRLEVRTAKAGPGAPLPVHEVFEIAG